MDIQLRRTTQDDLDFVLSTEQSAGNRSFVSLWTRNQDLAALPSQDFAHLIVERTATNSRVFIKLDSEWDGFAAVPDEFIDAGDTLVVLGQYSGTYKATSKSFKANFAHFWKLQKGKAARFVQYV